MSCLMQRDKPEARTGRDGTPGDGSRGAPLHSSSASLFWSPPCSRRPHYLISGHIHHISGSLVQCGDGIQAIKASLNRASRWINTFICFPLSCLAFFPPLLSLPYPNHISPPLHSSFPASFTALPTVPHLLHNPPASLLLGWPVTTI